MRESNDLTIDEQARSFYWLYLGYSSSPAYLLPPLDMPGKIPGTRYCLHTGRVGVPLYCGASPDGDNGTEV